MSQRIKQITRSLAIAMVACVSANALAQMDTYFTYQGQLKENGEPVTSTVQMRFTLWNALAGGSQLGSAFTPAGGVDVVDGIFTTEIDSATFGTNAFTGDPRWLQIEIYKAGVGYVALTPRHPITPAPYALYAAESGDGGESLWQVSGSNIYYTAGNVGIGTASPSFLLSVEHALVSNINPMAIYRAAGAGSAAAIRFQNAAGNQFNFGMTANNELALAYNANIALATDIFRINQNGYFGLGTTSPQRRLHVVDNTNNPAALIRNNGSGSALRLETVGTALVALGDYCGVEAWSDGVGAAAVFGGSSASTGTGSGIYGYSNSPNGRGVTGEVVGASALAVYGYASAGSGGSAIGVKGVTESTGGYGVWGVANATSGVAEGGRFTSNSTSGRGVYAQCTATTGTNYGVIGVVQSTSGVGVWGAPQATSGSTIGVRGTTLSPSGIAVKGESFATTGANYGVYGSSAGGTNSAGVRGHNDSGYGGYFSSPSGWAGYFDGRGGIDVLHTAGFANTAGLRINTTGSEEPIGVQVNVNASYGRLADFYLSNAGGYYGNAFTISGDCLGNVLKIHSRSTNTEAGVALLSQSDGTRSAVYGYNTRDTDDAPAVQGYHVGSSGNWGVGVKGTGGYKGVEGATDGDNTRYGVYGTAAGTSGTRYGVYGSAGGAGTTKYGVYGIASGTGTNYAGYFSGNAHVTGTLSKGSGTFKIDHPLDPENKYLYHSFVESPDMMNIYNGNIVLDSDGQAVVVMPEWFEALNMEFRYQLTCIGGFAQIYIAEEIANNRFKIAGGKPGLKVSWQVTGVRHDPFANANRVQVEVDKPADEVGTYLHPEAWGVSPELQLDRVREDEARALKAQEIELD